MMRTYPYNKTEAFKEYRRKYQLRERYGLTLEQYDAMVEDQSGVCAICGNLPKEGRRLCVDHCHRTGVVRGLLCDSCNIGLAKYQDNPEILRRAIDYLEIKPPQEKFYTLKEIKDIFLPNRDLDSLRSKSEDFCRAAIRAMSYLMLSNAT